MLKDKIAIITGASRGIGYACAERFIREGARVMLSDVDDEQGERSTKTLRDQGGDAVYRHCDVRSKAEIQALFDFTLEKYGRVDSVIANAAIVHQAHFLRDGERGRHPSVRDRRRLRGGVARGAPGERSVRVEPVVAVDPDAGRDRGRESRRPRSAATGVAPGATARPHPGFGRPWLCVASWSSSPS